MPISCNARELGPSLCSLMPASCKYMLSTASVRRTPEACSMLSHASRCPCRVCACMQTQHKLQLDKRDRERGQGGPAPGPMRVPMQQAIPAPGAPQGKVQQTAACDSAHSK